MQPRKASQQIAEPALTLKPCPYQHSPCKGVSGLSDDYKRCAADDGVMTAQHR